MTVTARQHYAIVFYVTDLTTQYNTRDSTDSAYAGGDAEFLNGATLQNIGGNTSDWGFQTWVDPAAAPTGCATPTPTEAIPGLAGSGSAGAAAANACVTAPPTSAVQPAGTSGSGSTPIWLITTGMIAAGAGLVVTSRKKRTIGR